MLKDKPNAQRAFNLNRFDIGVVAAVHRCAFAHQRFEAEFDIFGSDRLAVMEARFGAQVEAHPGTVRRLLDFLGKQAVFSKGFVQAMAGQGVVDHADVVSGNALVDKGVEAVKAAKTGLAQGAALGGVGVCILKMLKACRVLRRLVVQRHGVLWGCPRQAGHAEQGQAAGVNQEGAQGMGHLAFSMDFSHQVRSPRVKGGVAAKANRLR